MATNTPTTINVFKANKEHKKRGCSKPPFNLFKCLGKRGNVLPIGKDTKNIQLQSLLKGLQQWNPVGKILLMRLYGRVGYNLN